MLGLFFVLEHILSFNSQTEKISNYWVIRICGGILVGVAVYFMLKLDFEWVKISVQQQIGVAFLSGFMF